MQNYGLMGLFVASVGLATMVAWWLNFYDVAQPLPYAAPMQFNTALCFLLMGIGMNYYSVKRYMGFVLLTVSVVTLMQYLRHEWNYELNNYLYTHPIITDTVSPGLMGSNTAIAFMACALVLLDGKYKELALMAGVLVGSLGFSALCGYIAGEAGFYSWGLNSTGMAPNTALCFTVIGFAFLYKLWKGGYATV